MSIYDNYNLRFNTTNATLEMNTGAETWVPVPVPVGDLGLSNGKILVGNASNVAAAVTMSGDGALSNTGVLTLSTAYLPLSGGTLTGNLTLSDNAADPTITLSTNGTTTVFGMQHSGNPDLYILNGGQLGLRISHGSGTVELGAFALNGNNNPIRTNSQLSAGTQSPDGSAILQANSTTQGFLEPRMTTAQRDAISSPLEGLQIYNTDTHAMNVRTNSAWTAVGGGTPAGSNHQIQYNNSGAFGASADLSWTDPVLTVTNSNANPTTVNILDSQAQGMALNLGSSVGGGRSINFTDAAGNVIYSTITGNTTSAWTVSNDGGDFTFNADGSFSPPPLGSDPSSPAEGALWYNSTSHVFKYYNGTAVKTIVAA